MPTVADSEKHFSKIWWTISWFGAGAIPLPSLSRMAPEKSGEFESGLEMSLTPMAYSWRLWWQKRILHMRFEACDVCRRGRSLRLTLLLEPTKQRMADIATSDEPTEKHSSSSSIRHQYLPTESPKTAWQKASNSAFSLARSSSLDKSCWTKAVWTKVSELPTSADFTAGLDKIQVG